MRNFISSIICLIIVVTLVIGCGRETAEQLFAIAEKFEQEEKFEDALVKYEKILVEYPDTELAPDVYFKIAQIASKLRKVHKCVDAYTRIVELAPDHEVAPKAQFMIGYIYANDLNDTTKAKQAYNKFLEKYADEDSGMTASARFELKYMGKDISEIGILKNLSSETEVTPTSEAAKGN